MTVSAKYLDPNFNFRAVAPGSAGVPSQVRKTRSSTVHRRGTGRLVGAAGLHVLFVGGLLWSQPAWMLVFAPLVQLGVARSLFSYFGGDEHRQLTTR